jgi:hypothetical protein
MWFERNMTTKTVIILVLIFELYCILLYRGADKSLARPGRKLATATEDFEFHISYLLS